MNQCSWPDVEPIWQSASDAVVWRNGDALIRFLVNKPLVGAQWTLQKTIFFRAELPVLSRYPPQSGFRVLNEHPHARCHHIMPLLRDRIQQTGVLEGWRKVETFSCVDLAEVEGKDPKDLDEKATEYLKPGLEMSHDCKLENLLSEEQASSCRKKGHLDLDALRRVATQFPEGYAPSIGSLRLLSVSRQFPRLDLVLPDIFELFNATLPMELFLLQFTKAGSEQHRISVQDSSCKRVQFTKRRCCVMELKPLDSFHRILPATSRSCTMREG